MLGSVHTFFFLNQMGREGYTFVCKISTNMKVFQSKANCSLTNRCMHYIYMGGGAPDVNMFEQDHVVGEGDGPGGSPCGRGKEGWGSCK